MTYISNAWNTFTPTSTKCSFNFLFLLPLFFERRPKKRKKKKEIKIKNEAHRSCHFFNVNSRHHGYQMHHRGEGTKIPIGIARKTRSSEIIRESRYNFNSPWSFSRRKNRRYTSFIWKKKATTPWVIIVYHHQLICALTISFDVFR